MTRLAGKVALITGAARGLGRAMALRFGREGAAVIVNDLHEADACRTAAEVNGLGLGADVSDSRAVERMFARVRDEYGRLDILVNNAGITGLEHRPRRRQTLRRWMLRHVRDIATGKKTTVHLDLTRDETDEDWRRVLAVNLDGTFYCSRAALGLMSAQADGVILNLGSIAGTAGIAGVAAYAAAKAGILGFTRALAREVASHGIRVNALTPGWIDTDMTKFLGAAMAVIEAQTPLGRLGEAEDVAGAAVYLASPEAKFITGQVLGLDGGWHMSQ